VQLAKPLTEKVKKDSFPEWPIYTALLLGAIAMAMWALDIASPLDPNAEQNAAVRERHKKITSLASDSQISTQQQIRQILKAPRTAEFDLHVTYTPNAMPAHYMVRGEVHAQNGFGALLKNTVYAAYQSTNGESLQCIKLTLNGELIAEDAEKLRFFSAALANAEWKDW
jgi:hypothetical protein